MGIENRFLSRTGSQWLDSMVSLAKVLINSAIDAIAQISVMLCDLKYIWEDPSSVRHLCSATRTVAE